MSRSRHPDSNGLPVSLAIHLSLYCAVGALFALVLYYLMQPTRLPNPGIAAHKHSPVTLNYLEVLRSEREAAKRNVGLEPEREAAKRNGGLEPEREAAKRNGGLEPEREAAKRSARVEPERETTGARTRQPSEIKPQPKRAKAQTTSYIRSRPARRQQQPSETVHYAQQPSFGDYRPMY
jgi:hypothetical protein